MQGQGWSGATVDQQQGFNNAFFAADDNNGALNMSQDAMNSLYGQQPSEGMASVFGQFNPGSSFSHPSQIMMPQVSDGQMQSNALDGNAGTNGPDYSSQMMNNLNPAASTAAAAAYGHLGYNNSNSSSSQPPALNSEWRPSSMGGFNPGVVGSVPLRAPGSAAYHGSIPSYDGESSRSSNSQDATSSKRRRMTFTSSANEHVGQSGSRPNLMQSDSSSNTNDPAQLQSYGGPDGQSHTHTRPPFRHRRSRSGSDVQGNSFKGQSHGSFDSGSAPQNFSAPGSFVPPPALFAAAQLHTPSHIGSQPSAGLGHAASHPPGLGSRILRGVDVSASGSSAATDFTKRKGWTGRVVEELLDFVHVLDPEGTILFASPSVYRLTGWKSEELKGRKLTEFVHPQDVVSVEREIDRMRSSKSELLTYYRFKTKPSSSDKSSKSRTDNESSAGDTAEEKPVEQRSEVEHADAFTRDGDYIVFEATGHPYFPPEPVTVPSNGTQDIKEEDTSPKVGEATDPSDVRIKSEPMSHSLSSASGSQPLSQTHSQQGSSGDLASGDHTRPPLRCFFCSARPYPSKNTSMLDSFLELKLENEKLRLMIAEMDLGGAENSHERRSSSAAYHPDLLKQELEGDGWQMPINPIFGMPAADGSGHAGGRRASGQFSRQNSLGSHETSPVMRTGSRDGDLAGLGLSNVDDSEDEPKTSPAAPAAGAETERRKKPKQDDGDHVCTDCGRVDSPEWRKGPLGPKTLCNACGLRWAKKVKRKGGDPNAAAGTGVLGSVGGMQPHMMPPQGQHPISLNHPPPFGRTESGQMQGMPMGRTNSMSGINMGSMISPSPTGFSSMPFGDPSHR